MNSYYYAARVSVFTYAGLCKSTSDEGAERKIREKFKGMGEIQLKLFRLGADGFPDFIASHCWQDPIPNEFT